MTGEFQIISDGSCDLPPSMVKERGIRVVPFHVSFDGKAYRKEIEEIGIREFYQEMVDHPGVYPRTSLPSVQDYLDVFREYAKEGIPMLVICIATKLSGSMQSALSARELILEKYPEARIQILDSALVTVLQGLFVLEAVSLRDQGKGLEAAVQRLEEIKKTGRIFFTVGDVEYLRAGGRIGKVAGMASSLLGIKPLITMRDGEIFPSGIARSRKKTMSLTVELLRKYLAEQGKPIERYSLATGFGYDEEEGKSYLDYVHSCLREEYGVKELSLYQIGATIGVHTGPYPLGLGLIERA